MVQGKELYTYCKRSPHLSKERGTVIWWSSGLDQIIKTIVQL